MKRRKFLGASTLLPFLSASALGASLAENSRRSHIFEKTPNTGDGVFFYKPNNAWAADFIPLFANGAFQLFYLLDWRDPERFGEGTPWFRISTNDFVQFTDHGEMLPRGTKDEQDLYVFTGSAIQAKGQYHIFYTGHNPYLRQQGKPEQAVMHAVSDDMHVWKKYPEQKFFAPQDAYEKDDWRDPFVFWNEENQEYNMLTAARSKSGIPRRRGLTALSTSKDLISWQTKEAFYAPGLYFTHECPDLFKMGEWWYLLFSEFTDLVRTRYRMSRSLKGPWIVPKRDDFDGHAFYAAKTASDGRKRYLFGWNPTRRDAKDNSTWDWGGNLVVHEIKQAKDGELLVNLPDTVKTAFGKNLPFEFTSKTPEASIDKEHVEINAIGAFGAALAGKMPKTCLIEAMVLFAQETKECGLMLRASDDMEQSYYIRLEPRNNKLAFDMWPRNRSEVTQMIELNRGIELTPGSPVHLQVIVDGNMGVAYINDAVAMNFRCYDFAEGKWGVYVSEGKATFKDIRISSL